MELDNKQTQVYDMSNNNGSTLLFCRLMRRRIKVADPRLFLVSAAYMHKREEVVDEYQTIT